MPRSMTGFGQADENGFHVEIKGVNHRYRDVRVKLPRDLTSFEIPVRDLVNEQVTRGKVELTVAKLSSSDVLDRPSINWDLARAYHDDLVRMVQLFGGEVNFRDILTLPGVLAEGAHDTEEILPVLSAAVGKALASFLTSKREEGKRLKEDMSTRLDYLSDLQEKMKTEAKGMVEYYRDKLMNRLNELLEGRIDKVDEARIEQEVALIADRSDITEELVRLASHITAFKEIIANPDPSIGRRLDFMLQEINRELNTIGSKSQLTPLSRIVIEGKAEVEKIREQVQNIE
jgi:uncharacterized protein (TIGR00255 family)